VPEKLNTPRAAVAVLAFVVFLNGFLLYHYRQDLAKPPAGPPIKPPAAAAAAATPGCRASEAVFLGYSDALDGYYYEGLPIGGLSGLTYDASRDLYYAVADSQVGSDPARFYAPKAPLEGERLADPLVSDVTVLRDPQGKPFTGANLDAEGIAVTREGELLIASEVEPSILRFSLEGRFLGQLEVPQKFLVTPKGYAKPNASFESFVVCAQQRAEPRRIPRPLVRYGLRALALPRRVEHERVLRAQPVDYGVNEGVLLHPTALGLPSQLGVRLRDDPALLVFRDLGQYGSYPASYNRRQQQCSDDRMAVVVVAMVGRVGERPGASVASPLRAS
jgi:hypothetical protein